MACGVPHPDGLGAPAVMSAGILLRAKKYTETPVESHRTSRFSVNGSRQCHVDDVLAYTPPLLALKAAPNELSVFARMPHPSLPVSSAAQLVPPITVPEIDNTDEFADSMVQPTLV